MNSDLRMQMAELNLTNIIEVGGGQKATLIFMPVP